MTKEELIDILVNNLRNNEEVNINALPSLIVEFANDYDQAWFSRFSEYVCSEWIKSSFTDEDSYIHIKNNEIEVFSMLLPMNTSFLETILNEFIENHRLREPRVSLFKHESNGHTEIIKLLKLE